MDLRQLRYFVTIVQTGSMAAAAKQLHLAQPALSHHLKNLEREFDTRLLERGPKGMSATAKGELLYQHAVALLRQAGNIESAMLHGTAPAAVVSLGLPKTVARLVAEGATWLTASYIVIQNDHVGTHCDAVKHLRGPDAPGGKS